MKILSKEQTAEVLSVTTKTLDNWNENGSLLRLKFAPAVLYDADEIKEILYKEFVDVERRKELLEKYISKNNL